MSAPEFSRVIKSEQIGHGREAMALTAKEPERVALARRFGLVALDELSAALELWREAEGLRLEGRLSASLVQSCVVSAAPVAVQMNEPISIRFARLDLVAGDEIELASDECDVMEYDGLSVDIGEAVAQSLALGLDPFPRADSAEDVLKSAGILGEADAGAFGSLAALRDQMNLKGK